MNELSIFPRQAIRGCLVGLVHSHDLQHLIEGPGFEVLVDETCLDSAVSK